GNVDAKDSASVLRNWERIKQLEHKKESRHSALDGVPAALPALLKAQRTQEKASRVGFDWKDAAGPMEKISEELDELKAEVCVRASKKPDESDPVKEELGDLLFAVCNLARHLGVDAESALELSSAKFSRRFRCVEAGAKEAGRDLKEMTLEEMDELWERAKKGEA
ncbi:MAG: MazG family protein, partial [Kiritimatiellae bacterium]|nr:MazG family protein [Kiritimatiellia bacterium]